MAKKRLERRPLTPDQSKALALLMEGKSDGEAAEACGVTPATVAKWRTYDPYFQAAMNRRRTELRGSASARLLAMVPKALDRLEDEIDGPDGGRLALDLVKYLGVTGAPAGPIESEAIIDGLVKEDRENTPGLGRFLLDKDISDDERMAALAKLEEKASELGE